MKERKLELIEEIVERVYRRLEKEYDVEFTSEEIRNAIQSAKDNLQDNEIELSEKEFTELYEEWILDQKDTILEDKISVSELYNEALNTVYNNIGWEYMEAVIYDDYDVAFRISGSFGEDEHRVIKVINLSPDYWADTLTEWDALEILEDSEKWENWECKEDFINSCLAF